MFGKPADHVIGGVQRLGDKPAYVAKALERLAEDHVKDQGLHHGLPMILQTRHEAVPDFLRRVVAKSPHRRVRGIGSLLLAMLIASESKNEAEVVRLLESCAGEYKDVQMEGAALGQEADGTTLEKLAKPVLHRVRYLTVGKKAQEILGKDVDGKEFKLSDYRDKVVLLDFFADWCPHCVQMYPHERRLVKDHANRPFALLGISTESRNTLRELLDAKKVTWKCWSDGQSGPIARDWQVESFPTMYLLDQEGIIRFSWDHRPDEKELDKAVKELLDKVGEPKLAKPAEKK